MVRRQPRALEPTPFHCGICAQSFTSRSDLSHHMQSHPDMNPMEIACPECGWIFADSLALEQHGIVAGHATSRPTEEAIECNRCSNTFATLQEYTTHRSFQVDGPCADRNWRTPPRNRVGYIDPDEPRAMVDETLSYENERDYPEESASNTGSDAPTNLSKGDEWCSICKKIFVSKAKYNAHCLWCTTTHSSLEDAPAVQRVLQKKTADSSRYAPAQQATTLQAQHQLPNRPRASAQAPFLQAQYQLPNCPQAPVRAPSVPAQHELPVRPQALAQAPLPTPSPAPSGQANGASSFNCNIRGCQKTFRSDAGLRQHKADAHGVGGQAVDFTGRDSWMLNARARDQLRAEGMLRTPSGPSQGRGQGGRGQGGRDRGGRGQGGRGTPLPPAGPSSSSRGRGQNSRGPLPNTSVSRRPPPHLPFASNQAPREASRMHRSPVPPAVPTSLNMGDAPEMEQAMHIHRKITRLLIQSDVFIHHDGKMTVCGIEWTRIGVQKQPDVTGMFDAMCHLPKMLQGEYLPPPKAFLDQHKVQYPVVDFEPSPARDNTKPGLSVVALYCSKVVLANGLKDVVKVAAVDLSTCHILMNHLVCTDPKAQVGDWRTKETGLSSWNDVEQARKQGYKVFKGWSAVRSALGDFIDRDTIIVGHNLRSDLDALRMIHGRAVDIAKVVERAAKGPLSREQLGLDSLCASFPTVTLKSDPDFGRDALMNAFAAREMGLWVIKNREKFEKDMRQKSLDYQRVFGGA